MEKQIFDLIQPVIEEKGYFLESVTYVKENGQTCLRIMIDKDGIMDVEDCVVITKLINPILDEADLIQESYILDCCSKERGIEEHG